MYVCDILNHILKVVSHLLRKWRWHFTTTVYTLCIYNVYCTVCFTYWVVVSRLNSLLILWLSVSC